MNEQKIRVMLADDQRLLREGLRIILDAASDMQVVGEAEEGAKAVVMAATLQPDILLMDIRMPVQDGIAATAAIRKAQQKIRVILLTTYDSPQLVVEGLRAGAAGYLLKDCSAEELCSAIRTVWRGQTLLCAQSAARLLSDLQLSSTATVAAPTSLAEKLGLTEREQDVLHLMIRGQSNGEIAKTLHVSEGTVKTHVHHLLPKLGARDRTHAIILAHQLGFGA